MASTTSPLTSSSSTPGTVTIPTFSGSSSYASSFQQVLTRAVQLASLPVQQMQNNVNDLTSEQNALTSLESTFVSLDSSLQSIGSAVSGAPTASVSDSNVSASASSTALPGTYTVQVDSLGSFTSTLSAAGSPVVTDPTKQGLSASTSFSLVVNGTPTTITPANTSLNAMATAINQANAGVQATVINMGSNSSPDYRLAIASTELGGDTIQLMDGSTNLVSTLSTGTPATYEVNGTNTVISSNSRQVTLAPGLTVTLQQQSTSGPSTITVTQDFTSLATALSNFASAYNSAVTAVQGQVGQSGGALSGQAIVNTLTQTLQGLSQFSSGSGAVSSMAALGLTIDQNGQMSFDSGAFTSLNVSDVQQFLGGLTTGGFLQSAGNALSAVADTNSGEIETEFANLQDQINNQNQQISDTNTRIQDMENSLMTELTDADAAIATLESQKTYYQDLFQAQYPSQAAQ
jgi:flagellar hook-associated protein 2